MSKTPFDNHNMRFSLHASNAAQRQLYPRVARLVLGAEYDRFRELATPDGVEPHPADANLGIDGYLYAGGRRVSVQERFRRPNYARYRELTATLSNNASGMQGDFWKLAADLYAYGYYDSHNDEFIESVVVDVPQFKIIALDPSTKKSVKNYPRKRQTFLGVPFDALLDGGAVVLHTYKNRVLLANDAFRR